MPGPAHPGRVARALPLLVSTTVGLVVLGPALGPGQLLLRDLVGTPRSWPTDSALGLGTAAPRAVPQDAAVAVLSGVVDGSWVVRLALLAALVAGGTGAALLVRRTLGRVAVGPELVAAVVATWNPYTAERLLQGQWSLLLAAGLLPAVVLAALRVRDDPTPRRGAAGLVVAVAVAGLTPTGALLALVVAGAVLVRPGGAHHRTRLLGLLALGAATCAPWVLAAALGGTGTTSDPAGVAAFAARAEPGLGTTGSLLGLGGIWNSEAVPGSRTTLYAAVGTALLLLVVATGARAVWARRGGATVGPLVVLALLGVAGPALAATSPGLALLELAVRTVPGAGLLRDTQKWVALAVPLLALAAGLGTAALRRPRKGAAAAVLAVLVALPDLAWGVGGALRPVDYPADWTVVARLLATSDEPGDVAVLPGGSFRRFTFSGPATVLDPASRWLPRDVVSTGALPVGGAGAAAEDSRGSRVERLLLAGSPGAADGLAGAGVGWVLVERGTPGPLGASRSVLAQLEPVHLGDDLELYRVPGEVAREQVATAVRLTVVGAQVLLAVLLLAGTVVLLAGWVRKPR